MNVYEVTHDRSGQLAVLASDAAEAVEVWRRDVDASERDHDEEPDAVRRVYRFVSLPLWLLNALEHGGGK